MLKNLLNILQSSEVSFSILKAKLKSQGRGGEGIQLTFLTSTLNGSAPRHGWVTMNPSEMLSCPFYHSSSHVPAEPCTTPSEALSVPFPYIVKVPPGVASSG